MHVGQDHVLAVFVLGFDAIELFGDVLHTLFTEGGNSAAHFLPVVWYAPFHISAVIVTVPK